MGFANGGVVPAILTPGELVIDPKTASGIGRAKLDHMNRTGRSAFAKGGRVGFAFGGGPSGSAAGSYGSVNDMLIANLFSSMSPILQKVVQDLANFSHTVGNVRNVTDAYNLSVMKVNKLMQEVAKLKEMEANGIKGGTTYNNQQMLVKQLQQSLQKDLKEANKVQNQDPFTILAFKQTNQQMQDAGHGPLSKNMESGFVKTLNKTKIGDEIANITLERERAKVTQDFIEKTKLQIMAADKGISAQEALTAAERLAASATKKDVVFDKSTGQIIGHRELYNRGFNGIDLQNQANQPPPKRSMIQRFGDIFTGGPTTGLSPEELQSRKEYRMNMASMGLSIGASYGADMFDRNAGTATESVQKNTQESFVRNKTFAGALQGASLGASVGMTFGGKGAAIGAFVAAIGSGLSTYFSSRKELAQASAENQTNLVLAKMDRILNQLEKVDTEQLAQDISQTSVAAGRAAGKQTLEDRIGAGRTQEQINKDIIEAGKRTRQQFAGQAGRITTNQLSEKIQKEGIGVKTDAELYKMISGFIDADNSLNILIESSRQLGESFQQAKERITKDAANLARAEQAKKAFNNFEKAIGRTNGFLKAFADNLEGATLKAGQLFHAFDGTIASMDNANRPSYNYDLERNVQAFSNPAAFSSEEFKDTITSTFSQVSPQLAQRMAEEFGPISDIARELPQILSEVINDENPQKALQDKIEKIIPNAKTDPNIKRMIDVIIAKLGTKDNLKTEDPNKLAVEVLDAIQEPITKYGGKIAQLQLDNANKLSASFVKLTAQTMKLIEGMEKADSLRMNQFQTMQSAIDLMRGGTGEIAPNPQAAMNLFLMQQSRILGVAQRPDLVGDISGIERAMKEGFDLQRKIEQTPANQFKQGELEKQDAFRKAGRNIEFFRKALEDTVSKMQGISNEIGRVINELAKQRQSGASLVRRLAMGGDDTRREFAEGMQAFSALQSGQIGPMDVFNDPRLAQVLDTFSNMVGNTRIGGVNVGNVLDNMWEQISSSMFGTPTRQQEGMLKAQQAELEGNAAKAQEALNRVATEQLTVANNQLIASQDRLTAIIEKLAIRMQITQLKTEQNETKNEEARNKEKAVKELEKTKLDNNDINLIGNNKKKFQELVESSANKNKFNQAQNKMENFEKDPNNADKNKILHRKINPNILTDVGQSDSLNRLIQESTGLSRDDAQKLMEDAAHSQDGTIAGMLKTRREMANRQFQENSQALGPQGLATLGRVEDAYGQNAPAQLPTLMGHIDTANRAGGIPNLNAAIRQNNDRNQQLEKQIQEQQQALQAANAARPVNQPPLAGAFGAFAQGLGPNGALPINPLGFAKGGVVPGTGNTDSVPAMLTPGEVVIPKRFVQGGFVQTLPYIIDPNAPKQDFMENLPATINPNAPRLTNQEMLNQGIIQNLSNNQNNAFLPNTVEVNPNNVGRPRRPEEIYGNQSWSTPVQPTLRLLKLPRDKNLDPNNQYSGSSLVHPDLNPLPPRSESQKAFEDKENARIQKEKEEQRQKDLAWNKEADWNASNITPREPQGEERERLKREWYEQNIDKVVGERLRHEELMRQRRDNLEARRAPKPPLMAGADNPLLGNRPVNMRDNDIGQLYLKHSQMFDQAQANATGVDLRNFEIMTPQQIKNYRMQAAAMLGTQMMIEARKLQDPQNPINYNPVARQQLMMRIQQMQATRMNLMGNPKRFNSKEEIDGAVNFYGVSHEGLLSQTGILQQQQEANDRNAQVQVPVQPQQPQQPQPKANPVPQNFDPNNPQHGALGVKPAPPKNVNFDPNNPQHGALGVAPNNNLGNQPNNNGLQKVNPQEVAGLDKALNDANNQDKKEATSDWTGILGGLGSIVGAGALWKGGGMLAGRIFGGGNAAAAGANAVANGTNTATGVANAAANEAKIVSQAAAVPNAAANEANEAARIASASRGGGNTIPKALRGPQIPNANAGNNAASQSWVESLIQESTKNVAKASKNTFWNRLGTLGRGAANVGRSLSTAIGIGGGLYSTYEDISGFKNDLHPHESGRSALAASTYSAVTNVATLGIPAGINAVTGLFGIDANLGQARGQLAQAEIRRDELNNTARQQGHTSLYRNLERYKQEAERNLFSDQKFNSEEEKQEYLNRQAEENYLKNKQKNENSKNSYNPAENALHGRVLGARQTEIQNAYKKELIDLLTKNNINNISPDSINLDEFQGEIADALREKGVNEQYNSIQDRYIKAKHQLRQELGYGANFAKGGLVKPSYYEEGGQVLPPLNRYQASLHDAIQRERGNNPFATTPLFADNESLTLQLPSGSSFKPENKSQQIPKNNNLNDIFYQMTQMVDFRNNKKNIEAVKRANGGSIFKPQGTDTVPAMLTPGEFVMKKSAVDRIGHATLNKMNNGASYFAEGGSVGASSNLDQAESFSKIAANFSGFITSFDSSVVSFNSSVTDFGAKVSEFASAVATMPATLTVNGEVGANVTSNAAGIITQISNVVQTMIANEIKKALTQPSMAQRAQPS
jgi:hypothetical protein